MKSESIVVLLGILGLLVVPAGLVAQENSQPRYRVIELGTLGGTYSQPLYVSRSGVASGEASLPDGNWHATLWQGQSRGISARLVGRTAQLLAHRIQSAKSWARPKPLSRTRTVRTSADSKRQERRCRAQHVAAFCGKTVG
jgi:hypothetical protein